MSAAATESIQRRHEPANASRPALIVAGLLGAALVFTRVTQLGPITASLSLADLVLLPGLVILFPRFRGHWPLHYWLVSMLVMHTISWLNGLEYASLSTMPDVLKVLVTCAYALVGFAIGRLPGGDRAFTRGALWTVLPVCLMMVVAAITRQPRWFLEPDMIRVRGPMTDPNGMAIYLAGILPLAGSLSLATLPLMLVAALTTASRTGLTATMAALVAWLALERRVAYLLVLAALAVPLVVVVLPHVNVNRLLAIEAGLSKRSTTWDVAWRTARLHPFIGVGKGNYRAVQVEQAPGAHNTYLDMMIGNGVIGLTLFLVPVLWWMFRPVLQGTRNLWAVTVLACLVGGLAVSLWDWRLFWIAVGALNGQFAVQRTDR